eukprot:580932-Amphidinium_carterae.1
MEQLKVVEADTLKLLPKLEKQETDAAALEGSSNFERQRTKFKGLLEAMNGNVADLAYSQRTRKNRKTSKPLLQGDAQDMVAFASK